MWLVVGAMLVLLVFYGTGLLERHMTLPPVAHLSEDKLRKDKDLEIYPAGIFLRYTDAKRTLVWFPGNGYSGREFFRKESGQWWTVIRNLQKSKQANIFFVNYRAWRKYPSQQHIQRRVLPSVKNILRVLKADAHVEFIGNSLGGSIALHAVRIFDPEYIYLSAPLPGLSLVARHRFPIVRIVALLMPWFPHNPYDAISRARSITTPVFIVHREDDKVIPVSGVRRLYEELASTHKELYISSALPDSSGWGHMSAGETALFFRNYFQRQADNKK